MTEVAAPSSNSVFTDYAIANKQEETPSDNELGQSAFLELMITQLKHQDPLNPQENSEFVAQLAQFSSVESLDKLNNNFTDFSSSFVANQALQASSLVGRSVTVPTDSAMLETGNIVSGSVDIPASTGDAQLRIYDDEGGLVDQIPLGSQSAGEMVFRWDGMHMELNGDMMDWTSSQTDGAPAGIYRFEVTGSIDGDTTAFETALSANVNSVTVGTDGGLVLNLAGVGPVNLADIKQFNE